MKTTLFIVGMCNLVISCTSTHPRTIDLNLNVTNPINSTETSNKRCDLSEFIMSRSGPVDKASFADTKDVTGYVKALEIKQTALIVENNSLLKAVLNCHGQ